MSKIFFSGEKHRTEVIAHRGGAGEWPGETLFAFRNAIALGVDVLELDVRLTSDNHFVLMHDSTVDATTNGSGPVRYLSLKRIKQLDAGYDWTNDGGNTFPFRGKGIDIPTLEEVLEEFSGIRMNIEIKGWHPFSGQKVAEKFCGILKEYGMIDRVLVASFFHSALDRVRAICPGIATAAWTFDVVRFVASSRWGCRCFRPDVDAVEVFYPVIDADLVQIARALRLKLYAWTVNDELEMKRLIDLELDGIITDFPTTLIRLVR